MSRIRAPVRCLRISMQNMGGVSGFSRVIRVSCTRGWLGLAERSSFTFSRLPRTAITISSRTGW